MDNLLHVFEHSLRRLGILKKDRLLLAVSGGVDSVVLTACAEMCGLNFGIAHVNFQLRDKESDRDEEFVRHLAAKYKKRFFLKKVETKKYAETKKCSIQVAARNLRYEWFKFFIGKEPDQFQYVLTAHHLDDNIETMLMHFFRGTGISGLTGIPEKNEWLVRPLLSSTKHDIKTFAVTQKLEWVEDSSNASDDYTRNYFRNQLIPSASTVFPDLQHNLENNLHRFSEAELLYQQAVALHKKKLLNPVGSEMQIPILLLKKAIPLQTIIYEIIKDYHFSPAQTGEVIRLMDSSNGKYIASPSHRIIKNRRWLIIAPIGELTVSHITIEENESIVIYPEGRITINRMIREESGFPAVPGGTECLNGEKIQFPLLLRKWKAGDYFYPLGMKKKKKLARFFIDQKLSKTAKEKIWVLVMDNQIIWVLGHRIDNRLAIDGSTKKILLVSNELASLQA